MSSDHGKDMLKATLAAVPYTFVSFLGALLTFNSIVPLRGNWAFELFSFFNGLLLLELPIHHLLFHTIVSAFFIKLTPAYKSILGKAAAMVTGINAVLLCHIWLQWIPTETVVKKALNEFGIKNLSPQFGIHLKDVYRSLFHPFTGTEENVKREKNISFQEGKYGTFGMLDWYHHTSPEKNSPCLIFIHGGGWMSGSKEHVSGVALLAKMASLGWSCFSVNYRLAPRSRFPAQIIDIKKAIAFIKTNSTRFFVDPSFLCLTGGSAGGHLAALATLTANDVQFQRGFELADTSIQACIPFYGVYQIDHDVMDEDEEAGRSVATALKGKQNDWKPENPLQIPKKLDLFVETNRSIQQTLNSHSNYISQKRRFKSVWKNIHQKGATTAAQLSATPSYRVSTATGLIPPFFIIHGDIDTLTHVLQARVFKQQLEERGVRVALAEIPFSAHAFDAVQSLKTTVVFNACVEFLLHIRKEHIQSIKNNNNNNDNNNNNNTTAKASL